MIAVFIAGVASIALGARDRGQDPGGRGLVQLGAGVALCILAVNLKNHGRDARLILVIVVVGAAALSSLIELSGVVRVALLLASAAIVALLTFPGPSREWFEGDDQEVLDE